MICVLDSLQKAFKSKADPTPVVAVVTQAPKPSGRKQELYYSPVDGWAHKKSVPKYFQPSDVIKYKIKADIGVLASYGAIIPKEVINYFPYGILNIHPSLLPKWRGSAPVQASISTEDEVGATIIKIDEKLDHGPIISQFKDEVLPDETTGDLRSRLFERAAEVLVSLIPAYLAGKIAPREQDHSKATFTREIKKEDAFIPPENINTCLKGRSFKAEWQIPFIKDFEIRPSAAVIDKFIRAMQPWPGVWTYVKLGQRTKDQGQKRLKILKALIEDQRLVLDKVQLEGKDPVSWDQFKEGYPQLSFV